MEVQKLQEMSTEGLWPLFSSVGAGLTKEAFTPDDRATVIPTERKDADKGCTFTNAFKPVNIKALKQIKTAIENIHGATLVLSHQENG